MIPRRSNSNLLNQLIDYIDKFKDVSQLTILEVGSWAGDSASVFAKRFKQVICVDPWEKSNSEWSLNYDIKEAEEEFDKMSSNYNNIIKIKSRIQDIAPFLKAKSMDVIYIDGEHEYDEVKRDIGCVLSKCKLFISGHDYYSKFPGLINAVNEYKRPYKVFDDTSWIIKIEKI